MSYELPIATNQQMRDFYDACCKSGLANGQALLDRRGLEYLKLSKHLMIGLCIPPEGEQTGGGASYVRAVF